MYIKLMRIMESKDFHDVISSVEDGILKIVLNRLKKKNAITIPMYRRILQLLEESIENVNIRAVVLTGAGNIFSNGNNFNLSSLPDDCSLEQAFNVFKNFVDTLITYPKLLIAVVNGPAIGIAVTILPLFDMVYASDKAYFETPFTSLGLVCEGCSSYTFPKIFGHSKAGEMLYLGYKMNAFEAKQCGLISEIYKQECMNDIWIYLKKISTLSIESIMAIKSLVRRWNKSFLLEVNAQEAAELLKRIQSPDCIERLSRIIIQKNKL